MVKLRWLAVAAALAVVCVAPQAGRAAEEAEAPEYFVVHYDKVEPAMVKEFEDNSKAWVAAFKEKNMGPEWVWYAYSRSDFTYSWVSPMPNYAYLDGQAEREKAVGEALGKEKMAELMAGANAITTHYTEILKHDPELSYVPEKQSDETPGFAFLGIHSVKPAMTEQYKNLLKRVVAAYEKVGVEHGFGAYEVQFGRGTYQFVLMAKDAASFFSRDGTDKILAEAEGQEAADAIYQEWRECLADYETSQWAVRPDLSYVPEAMGTAEGE